MKLMTLAGSAEVLRGGKKKPSGSHLLTTPWLALIAAMGIVAVWNGAPAESATRFSPGIYVAPIAASEEEVHLLAATTWAEARSEGENGMRAVAHVMVNRVGPRFGDSLTDVILHPKQFSAWNEGDPNRPLAQDPERYARSGVNRETWETAQEVAREVLDGRSTDPTQGALFYHTRAVSPYWAKNGVGTHVIGQHVFYSDVTPRAGG
jgi:spore germination cell wall hydrolase CwlJ-like protein